MNDSILRGAQLFEIASADLRATSEHGKEIHTSLVDADSYDAIICYREVPPFYREVTP